MEIINFLFNINPFLFFPILIFIWLIILFIVSGDKVKTGVKIALFSIPVLIFIIIKVLLIRNDKAYNNTTNDNLNNLKDKIEGNISNIEDSSDKISNNVTEINKISSEITSKVEEINKIIDDANKTISESQEKMINKILKSGFERENK